MDYQDRVAAHLLPITNEIIGLIAQCEDQMNAEGWDADWIRKVKQLLEDRLLGPILDIGQAAIRDDRELREAVEQAEMARKRLDSGVDPEWLRALLEETEE